MPFYADPFSSPFGNIISETNSAYRGSYAWTGRELDVETDLQYNRAMWYDPATSRWMSQDPLGFDAGDSNLYRYVNNAPTDATDPSGLQQGNGGPFTPVDVDLSLPLAHGAGALTGNAKLTFQWNWDVTKNEKNEVLCKAKIWGTFKAGIGFHVGPHIDFHIGKIAIFQFSAGLSIKGSVDSRFEGSGTLNNNTITYEASGSAVIKIEMFAGVKARIGYRLFGKKGNLQAGAGIYGWITYDLEMKNLKFVWPLGAGASSTKRFFGLSP